jgi:bifunctional UDP-N-acetylglucosamine pyrophosphorylase/glucosamine-1-phosphate N-acetyltransferase
MAFTTLILAAGFGTRMKSERAKVTHEILGKPLVRWVVDAAWAAGAANVITIVGHLAEQVKPLVADTEIAVQEPLLGTGHAVQCALEALEAAGNSTVVILNGDVPMITSETIAELVDELEGASGSQATPVSGQAQLADAQGQNIGSVQGAVLTMCLDDPTGYGRIKRGAAGEFERIVEQKDATPAELKIAEVNSGVYCFELDVLRSALGMLTNVNAQSEYYLPDVLGAIIAQGGRVKTSEATGADELCGINDRVQLAKLNARAQQRVNEAWMLAGVTMIDPRSAWIGPDVQLAQDVIVEPQVQLRGAVSVGAGSTIGPNTRISDSVVGQRCVVDESVVLGSQIGNDVSIGPRAYLRPGTVMCDGSKAGTHVEIKNSTIGSASKVPHLSYIGDATLGADVNIGAGSITCNYDGVRKSATLIGDRVFVGSDSMLVAPIELGADVTIGAGSTITKDVPAGALGIERAEQRNITGWASKRKLSKEN